MKKAIIASVLIVALAAGFAFAHGKGYGGRGNGYHMGGSGYGMMGPGMMGPGGYGMMGNYVGNGGWGNYDCPGAGRFGQGSWNSDEHQKFLEETSGLRKELNNKRFEYNEAVRSSASSEQLASLEKEIIDIRTQIQSKAEKLSTK